MTRPRINPPIQLLATASLLALGGLSRPALAQTPAVVRQTINHLVHPRGQLTVSLSLQDVPIPSIYGPTADEGWA